MQRAYERSLKWVLGYPRMTLAVLFLTLVFTAVLFVIIPKGFIPNEDTGLIFGFTEAREDISFDGMVRHQQAVADIIRRDPAVESFMSSVGAGGPNVVPNTGRIFIRLKPRPERPSVDEVVQRLRPKLATVPGINAYLQNPPAIRIGGQLTSAPYQYTLQSADNQELYRWAPILLDRIRALPGFQDVNSDLRLNSPQVIVDIDRDRAAALGVTAGQIERALGNAYGARQVSTIYTPSNQYWVMMELGPRYQTDPNVLSMLYIRSNTGRLVPLNAVARFTRGVGPLAITHLGQLPSVTISFNLQPGMSLGDAVGQVQNLQRELGLPSTLSTHFQGAAQAFQSSLQGMGLLLIVAVLVIYLILGILYESFIHPLTILSGLPSAGVGALLTLLLFGMELNIYGFVGIIMLIGIVKKNAIMMIDFALDAERSGKRPAESIYEGALLRFRPIMMTTMAALMGTLPIALGFGAGAEARRPLGIAVVGGLLLSQLLTLYITPVVYIYLDTFQGWLGRVWERRFTRRRPPSEDRTAA